MGRSYIDASIESLIGAVIVTMNIGNEADTMLSMLLSQSRLNAVWIDLS